MTPSFLKFRRMTTITIISTGLALSAQSAGAQTPTPQNTAIKANVAHQAPEFFVASNATRAIQNAAKAFHRQKYDKSVAYSRYALRQGLKTSRRTIAYSNLCAALGAKGAYEKAIDACNLAIQTDPENWRAIYNRGVVYARTGAREKSNADMRAAQDLSPDAPRF